ncbi:MAG: hypothetical protein WA191_14455 [Telluria sp.]
MKEFCKAALALFEQSADSVRPGGNAEVNFKQGLIELKRAIDEPDPVPEKVYQIEIATAAMAALVASAVQAALAAPLASIDDTLSVISSEVAFANGVITVISEKVTVVNDKVDQVGLNQTAISAKLDANKVLLDTLIAQHPVA